MPNGEGRHLARPCAGILAGTNHSIANHRRLFALEKKGMVKQASFCALFLCGILWLLL